MEGMGKRGGEGVEGGGRERKRGERVRERERERKRKEQRNEKNDFVVSSLC